MRSRLRGRPTLLHAPYLHRTLEHEHITAEQSE